MHAVSDMMYRCISVCSNAAHPFVFEKNAPVCSKEHAGAIFSMIRLYGIQQNDQMLMYGKEASNRKQEIDRQHYTIPNQRPKDKHCGKI